MLAAICCKRRCVALIGWRGVAPLKGVEEEAEEDELLDEEEDEAELELIRGVVEDMAFFWL